MGRFGKFFGILLTVAILFSVFVSCTLNDIGDDKSGSNNTYAVTFFGEKASLSFNDDEVTLTVEYVSKDEGVASLVAIEEELKVRMTEIIVLCGTWEAAEEKDTVRAVFTNEKISITFSGTDADKAKSAYISNLQKMSSHYGMPDESHDSINGLIKVVQEGVLFDYEDVYGGKAPEMTAVFKLDRKAHTAGTVSSRSVNMDDNGIVLSVEESDYDENGNLTEQRNYAENGELTGKIAYEYHANGKEKKYTQWGEGGKIELEETYYQNGYLESRTRYIDGQIDIEEQYYEDSLKSRIEYIDGRVCKIFTIDRDGNGETVYYNENGEPYDPSVQTDPNCTYDGNGNVIERRLFDEDGEPAGRTVYEYYANGNVKRMLTYDADGNIYEDTEYYESGSGKKFSHYENGELVNYTERDENDNILESFYYEEKEGWIHRWSRTYDESGRETSLRSYEFDGVTIISDTVFEYDEQGNLSHSARYSQEGIMISESEYYENGNEKRSTDYYENGNPEDIIIYYEDGTTQRTTVYSENGQIKWNYEYYENGSEKIINNYNDGILFLTSEYYENGQDKTKVYYYPDGKEECVKRYNESGLKIEESYYDEDGIIYQSELSFYDENGRLTEIRNEFDDSGIDNKTLFEYDENGTLVVSYTYDENGKLLFSTSYE